MLRGGGRTLESIDTSRPRMQLESDGLLRGSSLQSLMYDIVEQYTLTVYYERIMASDGCLRLNLL